jgi:GWxTD domain-containing protein
MKVKFYCLIAILIFAASLNFAQSSQNFFDFDYAQFQYDSTSNFVEIYYSFNQNGMKIARNDTSAYVEGILDITMTDTATGKVLVNKKWKVVHPINDSLSSSQSLVGLISFAIPQGVYKYVIGGIDEQNPKNKNYYTDYMKVKPYYLDTLALSDIQLASRILENSQNKKSIFYKNTLEVTPQPTLVFGQNLPVVFYYYELYDREANKTKGPLKLINIVTDSKGKICYNKFIKIERGIDSRVEVGSIPVNKFPTDSYLMKVTLVDSANDYAVNSLKRFFVYNPNVKQTDTTQVKTHILNNVFGVMSMAECNDLFDKSKYIATSSELQQWKSIDSLQAKREFLDAFWKKRDDNPATPQNEYFQQYMKRVRESNQKYSTLNKPGWKTDRGRVLIEYGEPSEIERYPNEDNMKPYEIWHYNDVQGGVIFVFADLTGYSDYELINSTMRGELEDDNWQNRIVINPQ